VQIGRDPRISGPLLAAALAAGLTSKGVRVARFGYATTPAMFMSTIIEGETMTLAPSFMMERKPPTHAHLQRDTLSEHGSFCHVPLQIMSGFCWHHDPTAPVPHLQRSQMSQY